MSTTANIHKRYNLLFTLPSTALTLVLLITVSSLLVFLSSFYGKLDILLIPQYLLVFEATLFIVLSIEYLVLKSNPLAIFRRLAFISVLSCGVLLTFVTIGSLLTPEKFLNFLIIGLFSSIAFRLLVFRSVFLDHLHLVLPTVILQPALLATILSMGYNLTTYTLEITVLIGSGLILNLAVLIYLKRVNAVASGILNVPAITMLQAFLKAWTSEESTSLEEIIDISSTKMSVQTSILTFNTENKKSSLIIPEVHPGPFYPIGSSNLPYQIYKFYSEKKVSPLIFHGISGHELNLSSKKEVNNLLRSYDNPKKLGRGETCSRHITAKSGKAIANGFAFGDYAIIFLTLSPNGMEDFPREIKKPLEEEAIKSGFKRLILVDTHNSQGSSVVQEESGDLIDVTKKILKKLRKAEQFSFKIGYSHSSEFNIKFERDIGPAGIGILILEVDGYRYTLLAADSNNARSGLREELIHRLAALGISIIELCTSDTHITAGKVMTFHGYIALGDQTKTEYLMDVIKKLYAKAANNISKSNFDVTIIETEVKVVGDNMLTNVSQALDKTIKTARRGGFSLVAISIVAMLLTFLL
tara:strand:- start:618 stop:2369 length:1752 start_codon:yes stop_codon:yes gene_type:complete